MASTDQSASTLVPPPPPETSAADAARFAREQFGLVTGAEPLGSNQDRNFLLTATDGPTRLLKIANPETSAAELEAQSVATRLVAAAEPGIRVPLALDPATGAAAETGATTVRLVEHEGRSAAPARVLDYLDGHTLSGSGHLAPRVVRALGTLAARVDLALAGLDHPGTVRESQWDLRRAPEVLAVLLPHVTDPTLHARLLSATTEAWAALSSVADTLPEQVIHGDLTDDNVVSLDSVGRLPDGVIDFGGLNRSWTVGELAVTVSGLYLGAELVRDRSTQEPATEETAAICERMRDLGVIIQPTSDRLCVLKIKPPLCVTTDDVDAFVDALDVVLRTGWCGTFAPIRLASRVAAFGRVWVVATVLKARLQTSADQVGRAALSNSASAIGQPLT